MLDRLQAELSVGSYQCEPKWDGFRCLAFVAEGAVDLRSRHDRPLTRYSPELVAGLAPVPARRFVLDGEVATGSLPRLGGPGRCDAATSCRRPRAGRVAPARPAG